MRHGCLVKFPSYVIAKKPYTGSKNNPCTVTDKLWLSNFSLLDPDLDQTYKLYTEVGISKSLRMLWVSLAQDQDKRGECPDAVASR